MYRILETRSSPRVRKCRFGMWQLENMLSTYPRVILMFKYRIIIPNIPSTYQPHHLLPHDRPVKVNQLLACKLHMTASDLEAVKRWQCLNQKLNIAFGDVSNF